MMEVIKFMLGLVKTLAEKVVTLEEKLKLKEREIKRLKEKELADEVWTLKDFDYKNRGDHLADFYIKIGSSSLIEKFSVRKKKNKEGEENLYVMHNLKSFSDGKVYYNLMIDGVSKSRTSKIIEDIEATLIDSYKKWQDEYEEKEPKLKYYDEEKDKEMNLNVDCSSCYYCSSKEYSHEQDSGKMSSKAHYCFLREEYIGKKTVDRFKKELELGNIKQVGKTKSIMIRETLEGRCIFRPKSFFNIGLNVCRYYCGDTGKKVYSMEPGRTFWESELVAKIAVNREKAIRLDFRGMDALSKSYPNYKWKNKKPNRDREYISIKGNKIRRGQFYVTIHKEDEVEIFDHMRLTTDHGEDKEGNPKIQEELNELREAVDKLLEDENCKVAKIYGYPAGYDFVEDNKVKIGRVENENFDPEPVEDDDLLSVVRDIPANRRKEMLKKINNKLNASYKTLREAYRKEVN